MSAEETLSQRAGTLTSSSSNRSSAPSSSGTNNNVLDEIKIGRYSQSKLLEQAKIIVEDRTKEWQTIDLKDEQRIPRFHRDEIELANVLGKGGFFIVSEIQRMNLRDKHDSSSDSDGPCDEFLHAPRTPEDEDRVNAVVQSRKFMARQCLRHGRDPRYAFKTMQDVNHTDPETFLNSIVDLAIEFKFLASIRHPNILKMRAVSAGSLYQPNAFLVLDKIYDTLDIRIGKWKRREQNPFNNFFDFQRKKEKAFLAKRLLVAFDIGIALTYLHDINVMYRDLKPENIGFDVRDDAKLYDFGLATEFRPEELENRTYKLTGDTGTIRYMAPEVALSQPYTEKADVFSFAVVLWQILEMEVPYGKLHDEAIQRKVIDLGYRPRIDPQWPQSIRRLLQDCFASSPRRPSMDVVCSVLRREINLLSDEDLVDAEELMDSARSAMSARYIGTY